MRPGNVKISLFKRFILKIKNYYRRAVIGIKKGYSVNNIPPKTEKLLSKPRINLFIVLGVFCMGLCLSQRIFYFYVYIQYTIIFIYILFGLFLVYISILRLKYTNKWLKTGAYDVRNSPLDYYSSRFAKLMGRSSWVWSISCHYGRFNLYYRLRSCTTMKELGFEPIFFPFLLTIITTIK
jgi:hypothetical protein